MRGGSDLKSATGSTQIECVRMLLGSRPNVIGVGLGKRDQGDPTDPLTWRVYVSRKVPTCQLGADEIIPDQLFDLPTQVIVACRGQPVAGPVTHAPSVTIVNKASDGGGALGCFAKQGNDVVLLTAAHVLFEFFSGQSSPNLQIYSPTYSSCCGGGPQIATSRGSWTDGWRSAGSNVYDTDCAVAGLAGGVQYTNQMPQIGMITGAGPDPNAGMVLPDFTTMPTAQQLVRMYSQNPSASGLRYGTIARINAGSAPSPLSAGPFQDPSDAIAEARPLVNQLVILPRLPPIANETQAAYTARYAAFAQSGGMLTFSEQGDSGSVVVDNQPGAVNVLGLLVRRYPGAAVRANLKQSGQPIPDALTVVANFGIVTPISNVLAQMQIAIPGNLAGTVPAAGPQFVAIQGFAPAIDRKNAEAAFDALMARLLDRRHGRLIVAKFNEHREEARRLVNTVRRVSAIWIHCQGPAFMRHCVTSLRDPSHRVPNVLNSADFSDLLKQMQEMLLRYGSDRLRRDVRRLGPFAIALLTRVNSVHEVPDALSALEPNRI
jgi:hypothetical protein